GGTLLSWTSSGRPGDDRGSGWGIAAARRFGGDLQRLRHSASVLIDDQEGMTLVVEREEAERLPASLVLGPGLVDPTGGRGREGGGGECRKVTVRPAPVLAVGRWIDARRGDEADGNHVAGGDDVEDVGIAVELCLPIVQTHAEGGQSSREKEGNRRK